MNKEIECNDPEHNIKNIDLTVQKENCMLLTSLYIYIYIYTDGKSYCNV